MGHVGVEITLAGDVTIRSGAVDGNGGNARRPRGVQAAVVFAVLTLERQQGIGRDALAEIVWPDGLPATWPSALRSLVGRIRDLIAPVVPGGRTTLTAKAGRYQLHLPPDTLVDVEDAEQGIEAARQLLGAGAHDRAWQKASDAIACLRAPFLPGHHGPWVTAHRERIAELLAAGLEVGSRAAAGRGDHAAALAAATDAVSRAPLRESAHRCLMLAHGAAGNRGEALRAYQRLRRTLADELGVDPAPATEGVYLDLLGRAPTPPPRPSRRPPTTVLDEAWDRARSGAPTLVLVSGPAGSGKSRLVASAARRIAAEGGLVLFGRCDPATPVAYGPFVEAFDGVLAATPSDDHALATPGGRAELTSSLRSNGRSDGADAASDPAAVAAALSELLAGLTTARPAMLVLDDLQWSGADACRLLEHTVRRAGHLGVLFVAIARDDLPLAHPLHETLAAIEHAGWLLRVPMRTASGSHDSEPNAKVATDNGSRSHTDTDIHSDADGGSGADTGSSGSHTNAKVATDNGSRSHTDADIDSEVGNHTNAGSGSGSGSDRSRHGRNGLARRAGLDPVLVRPASPGLLASPGRLPDHTTSFVGRDAECAQAIAALRATRLVTLVGTGGVGKTRLAVEIVRRSRLADHPDGVRFCDVAELRDPDDPDGLVHLVAAVVGLVPSSPPSPAATGRELAAALRASRLLLVLDGCERARPAVAELVGTLLDSGTASHVLATSRAPLRARDERVLAVAPLPVSGALQLLVDRARAAGAVMAADDPALAGIVRRLDGLPLALELAAPRLATLAPGDLAAGLTRTFDLVGRSANGPLRQRTLQATVEWSWTLLSRPARRLLAALSMFRTGWTLDAAQAVAPATGVDTAAVPALLAELAEQSMVRPEAPGEAADVDVVAVDQHPPPQPPHLVGHLVRGQGRGAGPAEGIGGIGQAPGEADTPALPRYRMLGVVAAYAAERLEMSSDRGAVAERHALHFVDLAEQALAHRRGAAEPLWIRRIEHAHDDLRAALRWSIDADRPVLGLRLVAALAEDVMLRDRLEVGRWAEELAALPEVRDEPLRAVALGVASTAAMAEDRLDDALRLASAALDAERATGAPPSWWSRNILALLAAVDRTGDAIEEDLCDLLLALDEIARTGGDPLVGATLLHQYVLAYAFAGQAHRGIDAANELLELGTKHPSPTIRAMGLLSHGQAVAERDPDLAGREYRAALALATTARTTTLVQRAERALHELDARSSDRRTTLGALRALVERQVPTDGLSEQIQTVVAMLDALVALGDLRSAATICGGLAHTPWRRSSTCRRADEAAVRGLPPDHYRAARSTGAAMSSPELVAFARSRADELV